MINQENLTTENENLIIIDDFLVEKPGLIQPHGIVIILNEKELTICQVSQNTKQWLNYEPEELINQSLSVIFSEEQIQKIKHCLEGDFQQINPLNLQIKEQLFQGIIHQNQEFIFLELEPLNQPLESNFFQFYQITREIVKQFQQTKNLFMMLL